MKKFLSILLVLSMVIGLFSMVGALAADTTGQDKIVINQIYSGGNNANATYYYDFIELYNPTDNPVSLTGLSIQKAAKKALVDGVSFCFWNYDHLEVFGLADTSKEPGFVPLYDEDNGSLRAGIRYWSSATKETNRYTLYELDGYTERPWSFWVRLDMADYDIYLDIWSDATHTLEWIRSRGIDQKIVESYS